MKRAANISNRSGAGNVSLGMFIVSGTLATVGILYFFTQSNPETATSPGTAPTLTQPQQTQAKYPLHTDITATVFWVGENADSSNDFIHNRASAWMEDWVSAYGGIDDPENRCGYVPCGFQPAENSFYFALPFGENNESGRKSAEELKIIPWYDGQASETTSLLKNRWIKVTHDNKTAYGQWQDVGPFSENDGAYVFGSAKPAEKRAGLDLSPAFADALGVDGRGVVAWQFVDEKDVPEGPWKTVVTRSEPKF